MNASTQPRRPNGGVQSIDRAVSILRCFSGRQPELGISELARMTGLSTSTTHRLLMAMQSNRLVRQTSDRRFRLGSLVIQLAHGGAAPAGLRDAARDVMVALRDEVQETVALHELLPSGQRAVIHQVESHHELRRTYTEVGTPIDLLYGAPGKAILSMLPLARQEWWLSHPIDQVTPTTVTDPTRLAEELALVRQRGWATSDAERTAGIYTVAAPLFDSSCLVVGALGISVPKVRMTDPRPDLLGDRVRRAAWEISEGMGAIAEGVEATRELAARDDAPATA